MFGFKKKSKDTGSSPEDVKQSSEGLFSKLKSGLSKTSNTLTGGLLGRRQIDDELLEELETHLLMADVGFETTDNIIQQLTARVRRNELADAEALYAALADLMTESLSRSDQPLEIPESDEPFVILVVGINGAGKTTSIGKLAKHLQNAGYSVMLAAGDTFRAAAVEQLQTWGERNNVPVIAQGTGADSASVIFDALQAAKARNIDVLIADTAGRLHTQDHLMSELQKVKRVMTKLDESAPHETLLVVDGGTGQNALKQAEAFHSAMQLTGLGVTKLDGTAKGGVLFALSEKTGLPIRFIGVGEGIDDLREFNARDFVAALLQQDQPQA